MSKPLISIIGEKIDPEHGIELELDWTDEFVAHLRANGYKGISDEKIIQQWLLTIYKETERNLANDLR
jgi:hypothetical protein